MTPFSFSANLTLPDSFKSARFDYIFAQQYVPVNIKREGPMRKMHFFSPHSKKHLQKKHLFFNIKLKWNFWGGGIVNRGLPLISVGLPLFQRFSFSRRACLFACIMSRQLDTSGARLRQLLCKQPLPSVSYCEGRVVGAFCVHFTKAHPGERRVASDRTGTTLCAHLQHIHTHTHAQPPSTDGMCTFWLCCTLLSNATASTPKNSSFAAS